MINLLLRRRITFWRSRASDAVREKLSFNTDARDVFIDSTSRISRTARASISLIVTNHPVLRRRIKPRTNDSNFSPLMQRLARSSFFMTQKQLISCLCSEINESRSMKFCNVPFFCTSPFS